jgi:hypothetical protein
VIKVIVSTQVRNIHPPEIKVSFSIFQILEASFMFITRIFMIGKLVGKVYIYFISDMYRIFHVAVARSSVSHPSPEPFESNPPH